MHHAITNDKQDFVLLDVRGEESFSAGHVPTAINLPHWKISEQTLIQYPLNTLFVVYCAGPHCNGANKGAIALAKLGRPVKEMIGGAIGWTDEGFQLVADSTKEAVDEMTAQPIYIVDSFTDQAFKGNPAGVHLSEHQPGEDRMQLIASELNLSETAFASPASRSDSYTIRYFSPKMEIPLCGHATLAASKVIFEKYELNEVSFRTGAGLQLHVRKTDGLIEMAFPVYELRKSDAPAAMLAALGITDVNYAGFNEETNILMLEIESADELAALNPDFPRCLIPIIRLTAFQLRPRPRTILIFIRGFFGRGVVAKKIR